MPANPQLNDKGELRHLLTIDGLPRDVLLHILDTATSFVSVTERDVKKVPLLRGKSVFNLFFENSTRTRTTFEIAAKRLSADVLNLDIARSSTAKGETLLDTVANLSAMHADMFVVRHSESGISHPAISTASISRPTATSAIRDARSRPAGPIGRRRARECDVANAVTRWRPLSRF